MPETTTGAAAENSGGKTKKTFGGSTFTSESSSSNNSGKLPSSHLQMVELDRATLELAITEHNRDEEEEEAIYMNRSRLFLFACCDIRMGSIVMNAANSVVVLMVIFLLLPSNMVGVIEENDNLVFHSYLRNSLSIAVSLLFGIPGAWIFQKHLVGLVTLFFFAFAVWGFVDGRILGALFNTIMIYPNGHLFWALHTGTFTRENYPTHKRWCW